MVILAKRFLSEDHGQDLVEYTLLLSFVALASLSLIFGTTHPITAIWTASNNGLCEAASEAVSAH
jgi:Flp pilus assembly pilin Flp